MRFFTKLSARVSWKCKTCSEKLNAIISRRIKGQSCPYGAGNNAITSLRCFNILSSCIGLTLM
ncbi:zinc-ribbon domain-containing protein [Bacillus sp. T17B1]|uniref:zinc-ribbon domain-containing protein n=1 Tax=Bacillus sp. T17B1 TaxID=2918911 RepID=UPI003B027BF3